MIISNYGTTLSPTLSPEDLALIATQQGPHPEARIADPTAETMTTSAVPPPCIGCGDAKYLTPSLTDAAVAAKNSPASSWAVGIGLCLGAAWLFGR